MGLKAAFVGFRHGHIHSLHKLMREHPEVEIVAASEEDAATRDGLAGGDIEITHSSDAELLDGVDCDIIATGDYYGKRGSILIEALRRGKHVIADKPPLTRLAELDEIEELSRQKGLAVGCQLTMREHPLALALRLAVQDGEVGEVQAVSFTGQHPLGYGSRAGWYFEEGKQGGTINDIGIHAFDFVPWICGSKFCAVQAARTWNAALPEVPHFHDGAQMMLSLENGAGVLGDDSYLAPSSFGYKLPQYWRVTVWGTEGVVEGGVNVAGVSLYRNGEDEPRTIEPPASTAGGYFEAFLAEVRGERLEGQLSTAEVLRAARVSLTTQDAADRQLFNVAL